MVTNIDVTLRDGGYRNSFEFSQEYAIEHAVLSVETGIDWVEIGYRGGSFNSAASTGLTGRTENSYIAAVAAAVGPEHVGVMVHPHNVDREDLDEAFAAGARLVRVCLGSDAQPGLETARSAVEIGFEVCINITRVSAVAPKSIRSLSRAAGQAGVAALYLADSNGSLGPKEVATLVGAATADDRVAVGIHTHNHLGLALANAISALEAGASWVDSAVLGMGKGAGNLITEQWVAYLSQWHSRPAKYDFSSLLRLSAHLTEGVRESTPRVDATDVLMGFYDLPVEHSGAVTGELDFAARVQLARSLAGAHG